MFSFDRFEEIRRMRGITQKYIASQIGKKSVIFHDWAAGKSKPSEANLKTVAYILGTTPEYLTGETDVQSLIVRPQNEKKPPAETGEGPENMNDYLEALRDRPELRMLFSLTKNATKEDVEAAVRIIEALRGGQFFSGDN